VNPEMWSCALCVGEAKMWALDHPGASLKTTGAPVVRTAVTILGGNATCADHIQVQRQTPLLMPSNHYPG
jgi:hypothetical protein